MPKEKILNVELRTFKNHKGEIYVRVDDLKTVAAFLIGDFEAAEQIYQTMLEIERKNAS